MQIFDDGTLIATHSVLEGRNQRRVVPGHRKMARIADPPRDKPILILRTRLAHVQPRATIRITVFALNGVLDVKTDTSATVAGFNLNFKTLARVEVMGLFKR